MRNNGDSQRVFRVGTDPVRGLGSFHKTLAHNEYGEVRHDDFIKLVNATEGTAGFDQVPAYNAKSARLTNPQAGLAHDRLVDHPSRYDMPPAPAVLSQSTAAEMTELYWMALLRDVSFTDWNREALVAEATKEINERYSLAVKDTRDAGHLQPGVDLPGSSTRFKKFTSSTLFRLGLPGEDLGPMVSQFFVRSINFGTQTIDQRNRPYASGCNYLITFDDWLKTQNTGRDCDGNDYSKSNEGRAEYYEKESRYLATMRDLARFVNKDALHQAYFNAALLMLSGGAKWTLGNPYGDSPRPGFGAREAGFGTLGGPHILALVSEVATRALKVVWFQKWQTHLRLRPEAYGGLVHVQSIGVGSKRKKRKYGLPTWVANSRAAKKIKELNEGTLLLPMAFTAGSPTHPAYGAGHATVAGACVTILKAYFQTLQREKNGIITPVLLNTLTERPNPFLPPAEFQMRLTGKDHNENEVIETLPAAISNKLTIEGELNKLASNVAMGRSMGGVHWRSDNTRSLILGQTIATRILADITVDLNEKPEFEFRSFERNESGQPKHIVVRQGQVWVDGKIES